MRLGHLVIPFRAAIWVFDFPFILSNVLRAKPPKEFPINLLTHPATAYQRFGA